MKSGIAILVSRFATRGYETQKPGLIWGVAHKVVLPWDWGPISLDEMIAFQLSELLGLRNNHTNKLSMWWYEEEKHMTLYTNVKKLWSLVVVDLEQSVHISCAHMSDCAAGCNQKLVQAVMAQVVSRHSGVDVGVLVPYSCCTVLSVTPAARSNRV